MHKKRPLKIAYLFTTFPVSSETFLQREIRAMRMLSVKFQIYSAFKGKKKWEGLPIKCFKLYSLPLLLYWLPYWCFRKPFELNCILQFMLNRSFPNFINLSENLLGLSFALIYARFFEKNQPDHFHAVWASMPATIAFTLNKLLGISYSTGAHAYDIFEDGGDWLLIEKIKSAAFIHVSTYNALNHIKTILPKNCHHRIKHIRRGLSEMPIFNLKKLDRSFMNILSIGRLVEKKGYFHQLRIYQSLVEAGFQFKAHILGEGPLKEKLIEARDSLGLKKYVRFLGHGSTKIVKQQYQWANFFFFTGIISPNGDRDGLPNVVPEAMANGLFVITTPGSGGVLEAIKDNITGFVCPIDNPDIWINVIRKIFNNSIWSNSIRVKSRQWVELNFNAHKNAFKLLNYFQEFSKSIN